MKKINIVLFSGLVFVLLSLYSLFSFSLSHNNNSKEDFYKKLEIFSQALVMIDHNYVVEKSPQELLQGALDGVMSSLDPYSQYLNPQAYKDLLVETEGKFGGIGVEIMMIDGYLTVVSALESTPALRAGIKPQDIIIKINGQDTKGFTLNQGVEKLRGKPGEKIVLTILRDKELKDIAMIREVIKIKDIKHALILEDNIAYLKIAEFRERTHYELDKALIFLKKAGMKGLIIDLRNNPGGLLDASLEAVSRFLEAGKIIVSVRSREGVEEIFKAQDKTLKILGLPIIVIVNKGSASGSEIFAAALRQNNRATLIGETTFGKGSVQTVIPLSDGSALRLTTANYYTPWDENINQRGVEPDVIIKEEEIKEEENSQEKFDFKKDPLIMRSLDLIR